ncbi:hypothetical protein [Hymenobacter sp. IS2118]|uniref:hypothetical protein n=1 Tax=Hymenobacter sp. IS2118 TaxID=1505605 RepID=UPI00054D9DC8|nr:hypothetical protein [Hymenobacter sp. IS2118]
MKNLASLSPSSAISSHARPFALASGQLAEAVTPTELRAYAFTYVFRGLVVMVAALSNYALEHAGFAAPWLPWMVLMPLAAVVQAVRGRRQQSAASTSTAAKQMRLLQKSFVLVLLIAVASATQIGWVNAHPLILMLYGVGTVAAGRVLGFRPLLWGGAACGLLGAIAVVVAADTQLLLIAGAMLVSYVVPGYLLHQRSRTA